MSYESLSRHPFLAGVSQAPFKKNTLRTYQSILSRFSGQFGERDLNSITPDDVLSFLTQINQGTKQLTKRTRYSQLTSFFNFVIQNLDPNLRSPCDAPMLKKFYRSPGLIRWTILEKEVADEVIFRTVKPRNRLILELMAKGGMRISEVFQLSVADVEDRKLILRSPKSGKEREIVFIPQNPTGKVLLRVYPGVLSFFPPGQCSLSIKYHGEHIWSILACYLFSAYRNDGINFCFQVRQWVS